MAFWSSETLRRELPTLKIVEPFLPGAVKHCAYELRLGSDAFRTSADERRKHILKEGESFVIPPGQFGLLVTLERVSIPPAALGFISIKSGTKVRGLVNVSGFHVDPGFTGQLHFAVYNAGCQDIVLTYGDPLFCLWLCSLDSPTQDIYNGRHNNQAGLTSEEVMMIQGDVASPAALKKRFDEFKSGLEKQFGDLKSDVDKRVSTLDHTVGVWRGILVAVLLIFLGAYLKPIAETMVGKLTAGSPANSQPAAATAATTPAP